MTFIGAYRYLKCRVVEQSLGGPCLARQRLILISAKGRNYTLCVDDGELVEATDNNIYLRVLVVEKFLESVFLPAPLRETGERILEVIPEELAAIEKSSPTCAAEAPRASYSSS